MVRRRTRRLQGHVPAVPGRGEPGEGRRRADLRLEPDRLRPDRQDRLLGRPEDGHRHLRHPLRRLPGPVERRRPGRLGDAARAHPRAAHRDRRHHQGRPPGGHPAAAGRRHVLHHRVERLRPGRRAVRRAVPDRELGAQRGDRAGAQREVVGQPGGPRQGHDHGGHRLAGERAEAAEQGGPGHRPAGGIGRLRADPCPGRGLHRVRRGRPDLRAHRLQHGPAAVRRPPRAAQGRGHLPEPAAAAGQPHPQRRPERGAAGQLHLPAERGGLRGPLRAVRHGRRGRGQEAHGRRRLDARGRRDLQPRTASGPASRSATSSSTAAPRPSSRPSATASPPASRSSTPRPRTSTTGRCPRATSTPPCSPGSAGR